MTTHSIDETANPSETTCDLLGSALVGTRRLQDQIVDVVHKIEKDQEAARERSPIAEVRTARPRWDMFTSRDLREAVHRLAWIESKLNAYLKLGPR